MITPSPVWATQPILQVEIEVADHKRPFYLFDTPLGRQVCHDVLSGKAYPYFPFVPDVKTILDIGANVGAATLYFANHYPTARILAFEPTLESYCLLAENIQDLPQISIFNFGLYDQDQTAALYFGQQDSVTNSIGTSSENTTEGYEISLRQAQAVLLEQKLETVDILKVDTEGSELPILHSLKAWIPHVKILYVEFHDAEARLELDRLLTPTHVLYSGQILMPHRGELCYIQKTHLPSTINRWQIQLSPSDPG